MPIQLIIDKHITLYYFLCLW